MLFYSKIVFKALLSCLKFKFGFFILKIISSFRIPDMRISPFLQYSPSSCMIFLSICIIIVFVFYAYIVGLTCTLYFFILSIFSLNRCVLGSSCIINRVIVQLRSVWCLSFKIRCLLSYSVLSNMNKFADILQHSLTPIFIIKISAVSSPVLLYNCNFFTIF